MAIALAMSVPRMIPPSSTIGTSGPTAARISGSTSMVGGAVSSWRPPWFETQIELKPVATARAASAPRATPLSATGPRSPHSPHSHSASRQSNSGFICCAMKSTSVSAGKSASGIAL